jgi:hypothetical protein
MLADACEARLRAGHPRDVEQIRVMVKDVIEDRIKSGELNDTQLTMHDLNLVATSFVETLRGVYHPRIEYPTLPPNPEPVLPSGSDEPKALPAETGPGEETRPVKV